MRHFPFQEALDDRLGILGEKLGEGRVEGKEKDKGQIKTGVTGVHTDSSCRGGAGIM